MVCSQVTHASTMKTVTTNKDDFVRVNVFEVRLQRRKSRVQFKLCMPHQELKIPRSQLKTPDSIVSKRNNSREVTSPLEKGTAVTGTVSSLQYCVSQIFKSSPKCLSDLVRTSRTVYFVIEAPWILEIDYVSVGIAANLVTEKIELENALNWLSTLGGAFSALGEKDQNWAERAGKVSKTQMFIGMKLGSPVIMSRCRLYAAISLIQLGNLRGARDIILREYGYAKSLPPELDPRLIRMCIGIWTKLQFEWKSRKKL